MVAGLATSVLTPLGYLLYLAAFALAAGNDPRADVIRVIQSSAFVMYIGVPVSLFSMFVVGWPLVYKLERMGWLIWPAVCGVAIIAGLAGALAMAVAFFSGSLDGELLASAP
jgi:hypothetical protein